MPPASGTAVIRHEALAAFQRGPLTPSYRATGLDYSITDTLVDYRVSVRIQIYEQRINQPARQRENSFRRTASPARVEAFKSRCVSPPMTRSPRASFSRVGFPDTALLTSCGLLLLRPGKANPAARGGGSILFRLRRHAGTLESLLCLFPGTRTSSPSVQESRDASLQGQSYPSSTNPRICAVFAVDALEKAESWFADILSQAASPSHLRKGFPRETAEAQEIPSKALRTTGRQPPSPSLTPVVPSFDSSNRHPLGQLR